MLAKTVDRLSRSASVALVNIQGVKVSELEGIRDALFAQGLQLQVSKNNVTKLALKEVNIEIPAELLDQQLGMVFSYEDPIASAKVLTPFLKDIEALELLGGIMENAFMTPAQMKSLASLPSRDQLLGQLVGTLAAPLSGLVNVLQGNLRGLVTVLGQIRDTKTA